MPALIMDTCCGCIDLRKGCFIIGYLNLVGSIYLTVTFALTVAVVSIFISDDNQQTHDAGVLVTVVASILLIFSIVALAFAVTLLIGLHKNRAGLLKAYLIYGAVYVVVNIISFIFNLATSPVTAGLVIQDLAIILLSIYFLLVIRSMYCRMLDSPGPAVRA